MRRSCFCALVPFLLFMPLDLAFVPATRDMSSDSSIIPRLVSLVAWCTLFVEVPSKIVSSILHPLLHSLSALTLFSTANGNKIMIVKSDAYQLSSACSLAHPSSRSLPSSRRTPSPLSGTVPAMVSLLPSFSLSEEIKDISRSVGAIDTLLDASIRSEVDLQTIETTLGALLSLTVNAENKSYVREHNGLPLLVSGLARFQITPHTPQHIPVLHTALTTPRNCCSNGVLLAALTPHAPPSVTKEAVLLVKNLTLVDQNKKEVVTPAESRQFFSQRVITVPTAGLSDLQFGPKSVIFAIDCERSSNNRQVGNTVRKAVSEDMKRVSTFADVAFLGIQNIHTVRRSLRTFINTLGHADLILKKEEPMQEEEKKEEKRVEGKTHNYSPIGELIQSLPASF
ncbi:hypothetical protein BLNAU_10128 [Blattamonas nauphoetae]|uniref:Transmembrane protein n=1 Tax=Blattamonas nauphoetae TaxID=2049346 RepID=A0ABQ9XU32_9EUKA|nr:hypothetical protein BLNAU_10128 [Blattamonas nauphoetae]